MPTQIQFRRGTTSQHSTFTGAVGEMTIDTDKDTAIVHDGATAGGYELLRADLNNLSNPQFTGTGSIGIPTGTTAQRPTSPSIGDFRYNTTLNSMEWYNTDGTSSGWLSWGPFVAVRFNGNNGSVFEQYGNFSSLVRNNNGQYTITFASAEPNSNYLWHLESDTNASRTGNHVGPIAGNSGRYYVYGTSSFKFQMGEYNSMGNSDSEIVWLALWRLPNT